MSDEAGTSATASGLPARDSGWCLDSVANGAAAAVAAASRGAPCASVIDPATIGGSSCRLMGSRPFRCRFRDATVPAGDGSVTAAAVPSRPVAVVTPTTCSWQTRR